MLSILLIVLIIISFKTKVLNIIFIIFYKYLCTFKPQFKTKEIMDKFNSKTICVSEEVELSKMDSDLPLMILQSNYIMGYYSMMPNESRTPLLNHYYLLMKKSIPCFQDRIFRSVSFYEKDNKKLLHIYPGHMNVHGQEYNFIRFRHSEFDDVMKVLPYFKKRNIEFIKPKRFSPVKALIQFKEMVLFENFQENVYRDASAHHVFFFPIDIDIEYLTFSKMIEFIRNNCDFKHFEASLVYSVNSNYQIEDYAKIYSPNCEMDRLNEFEDNFVKAAKEFGIG